MNKQSIRQRSLAKLLLLLFVLTTPFLGLAQTSSRRIAEHQVRLQETVYSIAQRYQTTVEEVYRLNPWARDRIKEGDKLLIMTSSTIKTQTEEANAPKRTPSTHTIVAGETLYRIARTYGLSEEELMQLNPGITAEHFPVGRVLNLQRHATPAKLDTLEVQTPSQREQQLASAVRVMLMLPLSKTPRYLEFYQGFLMGMNDLKKDGISIRLSVFDIEDDSEMEAHIAQGSLQSGYDLVIGGVTEQQISSLVKATRLGYYIVPFAPTTPTSSARTIRINQSPQEIASQVAERIATRYAGRPIYFVRRQGETSEDMLVGLLRSHLSSHRTLHLTSGIAPRLEDGSVLIPVNSSRELANAILNAFPKDSSTKLFGYPQWQSYGEDFLKRLHERGASIYSSFFFDAESNEGKQFLTKFFAWYNTKLSNSFPRYGVLGYDLARYFIRSFALMGDSFPEQQTILSGDGLQLDIELERLPEHSGYVNNRYFLITFQPDGSIDRLSF